MIVLYEDGSYISVPDNSTHEYQNDPDFLSLLPEWGITSTKIADRIHSLVGSIKELEAERDEARALVRNVAIAHDAMDNLQEWNTTAACLKAVRKWDKK